jgi:Flp pilus assembly pilin Flp
LTEIFKQFVVAEDGQAMTEYALILALVAMALVTVLIQVSTPLNAFYDSVKHALNPQSGT